MTHTQRPQRNRYSVDLPDLHALCEANYARLMRVFARYETDNSRELMAGESRVRLDVVDRSRYTTAIRLTKVGPLSAPLGTVTLDLRVYHDARMAEVVAFQSHRRVAGRYRYPNPLMYHRDEKYQQNHFLADLLAFCLAEGRASARVPGSEAL